MSDFYCLTGEQTAWLTSARFQRDRRYYRNTIYVASTIYILLSYFISLRRRCGTFF